MNIKIENRIKQFIGWFFAKLTKHKLLWKKREDIAVFEILEAYLTEKVLDGEEARREELAEMQAKIEEFERFIKFIKSR